MGQVVASNDPGFKAGDLVQSGFGWREGFTASAKAVQKLDPRGLPPQAFLGAAGMPGLTAYVGLLRIAALKDGDVVFVSGGAGAVGSMVCQIAKAKGHKVIGSAGGADKVAFLKSIGVDHAIDYKAEKDLAAAIFAGAPDGIDVYFDNVGGDHLEAALTAARPFGRFAMCGAISMYNDGAAARPAQLFLVVTRRLTMRGFIVRDHAREIKAFMAEVAPLVLSGQLKAPGRRSSRDSSAPLAFLTCSRRERRQNRSSNSKAKAGKEPKASKGGTEITAGTEVAGEGTEVRGGDGGRPGGGDGGWPAGRRGRRSARGLFGAQRGDGIDACGPAGGDVAAGQRHEGEKQRDGDERIGSRAVTPTTASRARCRTRTRRQGPRRHLRQQWRLHATTIETMRPGVAPIANLIPISRRL